MFYCFLLRFIGLHCILLHFIVFCCVLLCFIAFIVFIGAFPIISQVSPGTPNAPPQAFYYSLHLLCFIVIYCGYYAFHGIPQLPRSCPGGVCLSLIGFIRIYCVYCNDPLSWPLPAARRAGSPPRGL